MQAHRERAHGGDNTPPACADPADVAPEDLAHEDRRARGLVHQTSLWNDDLGFEAGSSEDTTTRRLDGQRLVPAAQTLDETVECFSWLRVADAVDDDDS